MKAKKIEHGFVVEIPDDVAASLGISDGSPVDVRPISKTGTAATPEARAEAIARLCALKLTIPRGFKFNRDEANAR